MRSDAPTALADVQSAEAKTVARDSLTVAVWTASSRVTGLVRIAFVGAVLGPTFLGNTYQFTNSVPNLVYYGLLGGALVSSLLVPAIVRCLADTDGDADAASLAGGFLGVALTGAALCAPVIVVVLPLVLGAGTRSVSSAVAHDQAVAALALAVMLVPQVVCYALIACAVAVMNAHGRFALAAGAPTIENLGTIAVLAAVGWHFGSRREITDVTTAELLLLGLGSTAAVALHAGMQWYGARRAGIALRPRLWRRDPLLSGVLRRSGLAMLQAGLWSGQVIVMLALANRVAGGVVAVTIALNFFYLPVALGAAPVALASLPKQARHAVAGRVQALDDATARALSLCLFIAVPAAVGCAVLAHRLATLVSFGRSDAGATAALVGAALVAIAPGIVGYAVYTVGSYASYAGENAVAPLRSMATQAIVALPVMALSVGAHGQRSMSWLTGGLAAGTLVGAAAVLGRLRLSSATRRAVGVTAVRTLAGAAVMAGVLVGEQHAFGAFGTGRSGSALTVLVGVASGAVAYCAASRLLRSPELALLARAARRSRDVAGLEQAA